MIRARETKPFFFGDQEVLVSHPVGTQENYGAILTDRKSIFGYESSLSHIIQRNIDNRSLFLDIGAQIGLFSIHAALLGADVISFEMRPSVVHCHFETKAANQISNWLPLPYAVGEALAQIPISDDAQFVLVGDKTASFQPEGLVTCIPIDTLNLHQTNKERPTFVKMDIEGFEVFALRGMREFVQALRPTLAIECHPHAAWAYGASIQEIRSLLPPEYVLQFCATHRHESDIGSLEELPGELPILDNYMIMASPAERAVKF